MTTSIEISRPRVNTPDADFAPLPRPSSAAHVIRTDEEAIEVAHRLAAEFAKEAALRDREGILPLAEIDAFSQSGLWGIAIPKQYGGAGVSYATVAEVFKIISAADPSLGQLPQNQFANLVHLVFDATEQQKQELFGELLQGARWGNAFSERGTAKANLFDTTILRDGDDVLVNGKKFYATGALLAHIVPVVGNNENGDAVFAFAERNAPGLTVINDWSAFGQRTTASGTVIFDNVRVPASRVVPASAAFERPTAAGPVTQIIQAAIDAGIAKGTIQDTITFVREKARSWIDSGKDNASEDPFTIAAIGDLKIKLHAAEALLERAGRLIDIIFENPTRETVAEATIATAEAKVLTTEIAILAGNKLFELGGTRSTLAQHNLDRHWRNARTHTLHDPVRWKFFHVGNYYLNDVVPSNHGWL